MDSRKALSSIFLLLLLPLFQGSFSHPLDRLRQVRELTRVQELLYPLRDKISAPEALETAEPEPREQEEISGGSRSYRALAFQRLGGLQTPKPMRESGCFGRRLDRIGSVSNLGCNVSRKGLRSPSHLLPNN